MISIKTYLSLKQGHKPYFTKCCMNIRKWKYDSEPPAMKGVLPQIYAIHHIGRETIELAYTSFPLHKYISQGHIGPCHLYPGVYTNIFFLYTYWCISHCTLWTHFITLCNQLFVIRYSLFAIRYLFINVCTYFMICVQLFVIHYDFVHLLYYYIPIL